MESMVMSAAVAAAIDDLDKKSVMRPIYLDYNATTPMAPEVSYAVAEACSNCWANPSSGYASGRAARERVEECRKSVESMLGINGGEGNIIFTSGGTESNHLAMFSAVESYKSWCKKSISTANSVPKLPHVVTTNIEHPAVDLPLRQWSEEGTIDLTIVPVSPSTGSVEASSVSAALRPETCLVTVMLANNETGVVQPIREIRDALRIANTKRREDGNFEVLLHSDAAQAVGKIPVDVNDLGVDYLTIAGHKFYGPRIGALYRRANCSLSPVFVGGGQESGYRAGTENVPMIAGLAAASDLISSWSEGEDEEEEEGSQLRRMRDRLAQNIEALFPAGAFRDNFGHLSSSLSPSPKLLPNTLSASFKGVPSGRALLDACGGVIEASTAAACHSAAAMSQEDQDGFQGSPILLRSGVASEWSRGAIRLSVGRTTTKEEIDMAAQVLWEAYQKLLQINGADK